MEREIVMVFYCLNRSIYHFSLPSDLSDEINRIYHFSLEMLSSWKSMRNLDRIGNEVGVFYVKF